MTRSYEMYEMPATEAQWDRLRTQCGEGSDPEGVALVVAAEAGAPDALGAVREMLGRAAAWRREYDGIAANEGESNVRHRMEW